ncbi:AB22G-like protein [Mya arenaria]|uniref:AB22G-like protein n=1 Tax=Mya arenaria TaxID=6604 RepID=A0ABY7DP24_MYAAR|nr:AB22G-like protein [Mya arenaria]
MRSRSDDSVLQARGIKVKVKDKVILDDITVTAKSGELLAVLGPTGSGKTTLLNVISGRLKVDDGTITFNGNPFNKRQRRRLAFVQQQDVFFSKLTLWETLYFTAQLRLPETMAEEEKRTVIEEIVDVLDMRKCLHTIIGDIFVRGLSGGEKKRASIACELLTDPDILLLDEPTSGLDASTALTLMQQMRKYASTFNKTIMTSIHQPSSQVFHMFNNMLLVINGKEGYYGPAKEALGFFERIGLFCELHYNPADFILQTAKSDEETVNKILSEATRLRALPTSTDDKQNHINNDGVHYDVINNETTHENDVRVSLLDVTEKDTVADKPSQRWATSWFKQYRMLSWRSFKQTFGALREGYAIIQTSIVTMVVGALYWQIDMNVHTVRDIMGLKPVIAKERAAGAYRLSAYYIAKCTSDLPLSFSLPTFMFLVLFVMAGLGGVPEFFMTYPIVLLQVLVSQTVPPWLFWTRYLSTIQYPFGSVSQLIFDNFPPFPCNGTETSMYAVCKDVTDANVTTYVQPSDILTASGIVLPVGFYIFPAFIFIVGFRTIGYLILRFRRTRIL